MMSERLFFCICYCIALNLLLSTLGSGNLISTKTRIVKFLELNIFSLNSIVEYDICRNSSTWSIYLSIPHLKTVSASIDSQTLKNVDKDNPSQSPQIYLLENPEYTFF